MKKLLTIALLLFGGLLAAQQQGPSADAYSEDERKEEHVEYLISTAKSMSGDSASFFLERAINISKIIDYGQGAQTAFKNLIDLNHKRNLPTAELTARLKFDRYLSKSGDESAFAEELKNKVQIGQLFDRVRLHGRSISYYLKALALDSTRNLSNEYQIRIRLARAQKEFKQYGPSLRNYERLLAQARAAKLAGDEVMLMGEIAEVDHRQGKFREEIRAYSEIFRLAKEYNLEEAGLKARNNIATAQKFTKKPGEAEATLRKLLVSDTTARYPLLKASILQSLGILAQNRKDVESSIDQLNEAAGIFEEEGDLPASISAYNLVAKVFQQTNDPYNGLVYAKQASSLAEKGLGKDPKHKEEYLGLASRSYLIRSELEKGIFEYEEAYNSFRTAMVYRDSLLDIRRSEQQAILRQQELLAELDKTLENTFFIEDMNKLELERKTAEIAKKEAELERFKVDSALSSSRLANVALEKRRALDEVTIQRKEKEALIAQRLKELAEAQKREKEVEAERALLLAQQEEEARLRDSLKLTNANLVMQQTLGEEQARTKNLLLVAGGLLLVILIIAVVLIQLRRKNRKIAQQNEIILDSRKTIEEEKEKSDALLLNILPPEVAEELKEKGRSAPRHYKDTSVLFTDFKGFTSIAEELSPEQLVETLDQIFLNFDLIAEKHGLNRIKTIGDAYMAASGLPIADPEHAHKAVRAALEMRDFINDFNAALKPDEPEWGVRIGVNSGPVVAGVVGRRKFAYDIWGDTVNTASRMESSGQPGRVNVSGSTFALVKEEFDSEYRGKIQAKNKGQIDMYFVERS